MIAGTGGAHEFGKDGAGERALRVSAFGMPLHAQNKMIGLVIIRCVIIRRFEFYGFNHSVDWRDCDDTQTGACLADGLMVARIHLRLARLAPKPAARLTTGEDLRQSRLFCQLDWMRLNHVAAGAVIHGCVEVLYQRSFTPHIECLQSVADGKQRLAVAEGCFEQQRIDCMARGIGLAALGNAPFAVERRINVIATAGEKNAVDSGKERGGLFVGF